MNSILSKETIANLKVGDEINFMENTIKFKKVESFSKSNFRSLVGFFEIKNSDNKKYLFNPEIRIYNQPEVITSEADISSTIFSDNFLVFNVLKNDGFYNVRYQIKPFMIWIWISVILISFGGLISLKKKNV